MHIIVGLGNPGEEYENTRHNVGRILLDGFWNAHKEFDDWKEDGKKKAIISEGKIGPKSGAGAKKNKVMLVEPNNFMNNSGKSLTTLVKSKKDASRTVVIYDDLDLPFGSFKISFNRGSGGHKGVESVTKNIKTKEFVRIRVGVSPTTPTGKLKKPKGDKKVLDFIMKSFTPNEMKVLKKVGKSIAEALEVIIKDGHQKAMNQFN